MRGRRVLTWSWAYAAPRAPVAQSAEAADLKSAKCRFESDRGHRSDQCRCETSGLRISDRGAVRGASCALTSAPWPRQGPYEAAPGAIERRPSGAFRVKVYSDVAPVTKRRIFLRETVPPGPHAEREAEKVRTRLFAQVDERRQPRSNATIARILERCLVACGWAAVDRNSPHGCAGSAAERRGRGQCDLFRTSTTW